MSYLSNTPGGGGPGVDPSIGGPITGGTAGSIIFVDPSGFFAQDNANLFYNNANNRLGVGINTPGATVSVVTTAANPLNSGIYSAHSLALAVNGTNAISGVYSGTGSGIGINTIGVLGGHIGVGDGNNVGVFGESNGIGGTGLNIGVFGTASGSIGTNWAGYFNNGDVYIANNLGINTTTPTEALHVIGNAIIDGKLTVTGSIDPTDILIEDSVGLAAYQEWRAGQNAAVSSANAGRIRYNATSQTFQVSENGGAYIDLSTGGTVNGTGVAGQVTFWTSASNISGNTQFIWDNTNGELSIGSANTDFNLGPFTLQSKVLVGIDDVNSPAFTLIPLTLDASGGKSPYMAFIKSNGDLTTRTIVSDGDILMGLLSLSFDGVENLQTSGIVTNVVGTPSAGDISTSMQLSVADTGISVTAIHITPSGDTGIGNTTPTQKLDVSGSINVGDVGDATAWIYKEQSPFIYTPAPGTLFVGENVGNITAPSFNFGFGFNVLPGITTGINNIGIGSATLIALTTGDDNTVVGTEAMQLLTTGSRNTGVGSSSGTALVAGTDNTFMGYGADTTVAGLVNSTAIGANAIVSASNTIVLGDPTVNMNLVMGDTVAPAGVKVYLKELTSHFQFRMESPDDTACQINMIRGTGQSYFGPSAANEFHIYAGTTSLAVPQNIVFFPGLGEVARLTTTGFGVGTSTPAAAFHALVTTEQLRLGYNASNYTSFTVNSTGDLTINPTGPTTTINGLVYQTGLGQSTYFGEDAGGNDDLTLNQNAGFGYQALFNNTSGAGNMAIGRTALYNNLSGINNVAIGNGALYTNAFGDNNMGIGALTLFGNEGGQNTAIGNAALSGLLDGNTNVAIGSGAGSLYNGGLDDNTSSDNSIFIGANTEPLADNQTNQIVIGHIAIGIGSNTVVLGNDSIVTTALKGNVGVGTTTPTSRLHINGSISVKRTGTGVNYSVLNTDYYVGATANAITITLPTIASSGGGKVFVIKDESGTASIVNPITVDGNGAETIDGAANYLITSAYQSITLLNNGTEWSKI